MQYYYIRPTKASYYNYYYDAAIVLYSKTFILYSSSFSGLAAHCQPDRTIRPPLMYIDLSGCVYIKMHACMWGLGIYVSVYVRMYLLHDNLINYFN
jgi:hypothetical protein